MCEEMTIESMEYLFFQCPFAISSRVQVCYILPSSSQSQHNTALAFFYHFRDKLVVHYVSSLLGSWELASPRTRQAWATSSRPAFHLGEHGDLQDLHRQFQG